MSTGIWAAAAGAVNQATSLDIAANNVANASTPGYKADRAVFREYLSKSIGTNTPSQAYRYSSVQSIAPDFEVGDFKPTGRGLDLAIVDRNAFIAIATPDGERYTRAGNLHVDARGFVITREGQSVQGPDRRPLRIGAAAGTTEVGKNGEVLVNGEPAGRIRFVKFANPEVLEKQGATLFKLRDGAARATEAKPTIELQTLELSNKSPVKGMTGLAGSARSFEFLTKVIEAFSDVDKRAATDIAK